MNRTVQFISFLTFLLISFNGISAEAKIKTEVILQEQFPSVMEQAFLRSLDNVILDIMSKHGDNQLFEYGRIEKISKDPANDSYDISLKVIGFEGAHKPPFKLIRMTIRIPGKQNNYNVISYSHQHISDKEFDILSKYVAD